MRPAHPGASAAICVMIVYVPPPRSCEPASRTVGIEPGSRRSRTAPRGVDGGGHPPTNQCLAALRGMAVLHGSMFHTAAGPPEAFHASPVTFALSSSR